MGKGAERESFKQISKVSEIKKNVLEFPSVQAKVTPECGE